MALTPQQIITQYFWDNICNKGHFISQQNVAKKLLKTYSFDDMMAVLEYIKENNINMYSLKYLEFCMDKLLSEVKHKEAQEKLKELEKNIEKKFDKINIDDKIEQNNTKKKGFLRW